MSVHGSRGLQTLFCKGVGRRSSHYKIIGAFDVSNDSCFLGGPVDIDFNCLTLSVSTFTYKNKEEVRIEGRELKSVKGQSITRYKNLCRERGRETYSFWSKGTLVKVCSSLVKYHSMSMK